MKKIIFLMPIFQTGGVERILFNIIKLLNNSYKIELILDQSPVQCKLWNDLKNLKIKTTILTENIFVPEKPKNFIKRKIWRIKYKNHLKEKKELVKNICQQSDLIIDFFSGHMWKYCIDLDLNTPKICWFHCSIKAAQNSELLNRAVYYDKIIGLTNIFCKEFETLYPNSPIFHINNPMDIETIVQQSKQNLPTILNNKRYFVSVARLSTDKDIETLIWAFKIFLDKTKSSTNLCLIGTGNNENYLKNLVNHLHLNEKILFLGNQSNPYPFIRNSKALILSSENEASPCVLIESMICNTIPVSSDCPTGPKELLDFGKRGILFPVKDSNTLSEILKNIDTGKIKKIDYSLFWKDYIQNLSLKNFKKQFEKIFFTDN